MDLPLDLGDLQLSRTADYSRTELRVDVTHADGLAYLPVADVQQLAGALLQWLTDNGHELPLIDLPDLWK